jgi:hypothetical protein
MRLNFRISQVIILFGIIFITLNSFEQAWAQDSTLEEESLDESPSRFLGTNSMLEFLLFIIGVALYSLFVWYFYRFISKRDLLPKIFYPVTNEKNVSKIKIVGCSAAYLGVFPLIVFVWFIVLAFFVFFIGKEMPFEIALFVSLVIIAVVRILSYYREDASKEVAKMIPYAILSFFLTSLVVFNDPNFLTEKHFNLIPTHFIGNLEQIASAIIIITIFEFSFRVAFIIKRKILPKSDKKLEEEIESEVEEITKAHFKKMEQKQNESEKKIDELIKKLKDVEKAHS